VIHLEFLNLDRSELAKEAVEESLGPVLKHFPFVISSNIWVSLSMEHSPSNSAPDLFRVNMRLKGGAAQGVVASAEAVSLFVALSEAAQDLARELEKISDTPNRRTSNG